MAISFTSLVPTPRLKQRAFYASAIKKDGLIVNAPTKLGLSLPSLGLETSFAQAIPSIVATNGG